jgi:hypothetical protein
MKSEAVSSIFIAVFGLGLGASLPAMARAQEALMPHGCSTTPAELQAEKKVALNFYRPGTTLRELIAMIDPSYIQHNPLVLKSANGSSCLTVTRAKRSKMEGDLHIRFKTAQ